MRAESLGGNLGEQTESILLDTSIHEVSSGCRERQPEHNSRSPVHALICLQLISKPLAYIDKCATCTHIHLYTHKEKHTHTCAHIYAQRHMHVGTHIHTDTYMHRPHSLSLQRTLQLSQELQEVKSMEFKLWGGGKPPGMMGRLP